MGEYVVQQLGNYRLRRLLGHGGFADVYLGEHIHLETLAAIKVLHVQMDIHELVDFRREAKIIAHLLHPHIVRVLDFGVEGNTPFLVMDYAPKGSLRQNYPKGTRLALPTIIPYVKQVAQALQYAHDRKVVHRDVKPENILLDSNDQVLLSDFGISAIEQNTTILIAQKSITQKKSISNQVGSPFYMAPEQIHGDPHPSSDQYALGIVVYEWLCGSRPFSGEPLAVMYQQTNVPPPPLQERIPAISPAIEQVVLKALSKDPQQRYATIWNFAEALEQASQAQDAVTFLATTLPAQPAMRPQLAAQVRQAQEAAILQPPRYTPMPVSVAAPVRQRRRPSRGVAMLLIALVLVLVAGSAAFLLASLRNQSNATSPMKTPAANLSATSTASFRAAAASAANAYNTAAARGIMLGFDAQHTHVNPYERVLSRTNVSTLVQAWKAATGDSIGSTPTVADGYVYFTSGDRDGNLYALNASTGQVLWTKKIGSYDIGCAPTVANGVVYMGAPDHNLYALDARTGATLWAAPTGGRIGSSPTLVNGVIYIGSDDGVLYAIDASKGKQLWAFPTSGLIRSSPAVANSIVYAGSDDGVLYAVNASTGGQIWAYSTNGPIRSSPAVANGVVYVGSGDHKLYALNANTGTLSWSYLTGGSITASPAVTGAVVYIGSEDHTLYAFDAAQGTLLWTAATGNGIDSSPTIANGVLYIGSNDDRLYAFNAAGCGKTACSPLWQASTGGSVRSSPTVANGFVYVGSNDDNLYAFHLPGVAP